LRRFVYKQEYVRPDATRVSDGVVVRMKHHYEVDPDRMGQQFNQHLNWMHEHFASKTLVAGQESELDLGPGQATGEAYPVPTQAPARHPKPILPY
jgi:hypothetical protein